MIITGNVPEDKADIIVKSVLIKMGYSKELELKRYVLEDNRISYVIYNPIMYHGKKTKIMRIFSCREYMKYLIYRSCLHFNRHINKYAPVRQQRFQCCRMMDHKNIA